MDRKYHGESNGHMTDAITTRKSRDLERSNSWHTLRAASPILRFGWRCYL